MPNSNVKKPTDFLIFTDLEIECLKAATNAIDAVAPQIQVSSSGPDSSGTPRDHRVYARNLLTDIIHDKYDECVSASTPLELRKSASLSNGR